MAGTVRKILNWHAKLRLKAGVNAFRQKTIGGEIVEAQIKLGRMGIRRGNAGHTTRRIRRELVAIGKRSPGFKPVKVHSKFVANFGNEIAKALNAQFKARGIAKGARLDRGLIVQIGLAHDSRRDFKDQDAQAQIIWARRGAPRIAKLIGTGASWSLANYASWPLERKILGLGDNICRGVKVGNTFKNGIIPSETAYKLLISQRQKDTKMVDAMTRERQAVIKFEKELEGNGVDVHGIIRKMMQKNPKGFLEEVQRQTDQKVDEIMRASFERCEIRSF
ncbi:MAG: hypothetical protein PHH08_04625 [Candidatus ainarchaeum sp.]|nr:hypothetical protein [Candidatus ainarchaeum sp.]